MCANFAHTYSGIHSDLSKKPKAKQTLMNQYQNINGTHSELNVELNKC